MTSDATSVRVSSELGLQIDLNFTAHTITPTNSRPSLDGPMANVSIVRQLSRVAPSSVTWVKPTMKLKNIFRMSAEFHQVFRR